MLLRRLFVLFPHHTNHALYAHSPYKPCRRVVLDRLVKRSPCGQYNRSGGTPRLCEAMRYQDPPGIQLPSWRRLLVQEDRATGRSACGLCVVRMPGVASSTRGSQVPGYDLRLPNGSKSGFSHKWCCIHPIWIGNVLPASSFPFTMALLERSRA